MFKQKDFAFSVIFCIFAPKYIYNPIEAMKKFMFLALLAIMTLGVRAQEVVYLTTAQFKAQVFDYTQNATWKYQGKLPCVIDFYTTWCGPCKRLAPIMEELAVQYQGKVIFYKVYTEREPELAQLFRIQSIPTLLFCPMNSSPQIAHGLLPKETLQQAIEEVVLK